MRRLSYVLVFSLTLVSLLLALGLLGLGTYALVSYGFFRFSFHWKDILAYLAVALVVYGIVWAMGAALNRRFDNSVSRFLEGKTTELRLDRGSLWSFGFLLTALLPFLLYLFVLALYCALAFAVYGFMLLSSVGRAPIAVPIGLIIIVVGTAIAVFVGFFRLLFPPTPERTGAALEPSKEPKLWDAIRAVAPEVQARPVQEVAVTPLPGISVHSEGNLLEMLLDRTGQVLQVGIASLHGLTVDEFKAILAHEYGHVSHGDTRWAAFTYSLGNSLIRTLQSMPGPPAEEEEGGGLVRLIISANPAYWLLKAFVGLFFRVTRGFSRVREVLADIRAMQLYGGDAFGSALEKVALNDLLFALVVMKGRRAVELPGVRVSEPRTLKLQMLAENQPHSLMGFVFAHAELSDLDALRSAMLDADMSSGPYDSHPDLRTRLGYAARYASKETPDVRPVSSLFDDWHKVNESQFGSGDVALFVCAKVWSELPEAMRRLGDTRSPDYGAFRMNQV